MTARAYGWAIDPDTSAPLGIHLYVDGALRTGGTGTCTDCAVLTGQDRPDVQRAFPGWLGHQFTIDVPLPRPDAQICAFAMDAPGTTGINVFLGCKTAGGSHDPTGAVALRMQGSAFPQHNTEDAYGWAVDPDTQAPAQVVVYWFASVFLGNGELRVDWSQPFRAEVLVADAAQVDWLFPAGPTGPSPLIGARYFGPAKSNFLAGHLPYGGFCAYALNTPGTPGTTTLLSCSEY